MDPTTDPIDPAWWDAALPDVVHGEYVAPELLFTHLRRAAENVSVAGLEKLVLDVLAGTSSATLTAEDWLEPFAPAMQLSGRRTVVPADLDEEQVALLARIAPLMTRDDLQARVADVAWCYGDRSNVAMLDRAIDAYRAAPLTPDAWFGVGKDAWVRAFALLGRRGPEGQLRTEEMSDALVAAVVAGRVDDNFLTVSIAATLRRHGRVHASRRGEVVQALFALATEAASANLRLSRALEREAVSWVGGTDAPTANAATERIARTYIAEADARIQSDPHGGALVEGHFLEKAIAVLRTIPRSFRVAHGLDAVIDELRGRLHASRESSIEQMTRIQAGPIDLTEAVAHARSRVAGHADRFDALAAFSMLVPPLDEQSTRKSAEEMVEGSISHIFGRSTISADFRKVESTSGSASAGDEGAVWAEMIRTVFFHSQLIGKGVLQPALEVLTTQHRFSRDYLVSVAMESPVVPEGHERLWGAGLAYGLSGDLGAAVSILVPQLEQVVRVMLKRRDVYTLFVDDQGVESEKSLNTLLEMHEAEDVFGAGMVMEMKALLVVQAGPNLRNDVAHGLLNDDSAWSFASLYIWWFCLRLVMLPLLGMREQANEQPVSGPEAEAFDVAAGGDVGPQPETP